MNPSKMNWQDNVGLGYNTHYMPILVRLQYTYMPILVLIVIFWSNMLWYTIQKYVLNFSFCIILYVSKLPVGAHYKIVQFTVNSIFVLSAFSRKNKSLISVCNTEKQKADSQAQQIDEKVLTRRYWDPRTFVLSTKSIRN